MFQLQALDAQLLSLVEFLFASKAIYQTFTLLRFKNYNSYFLLMLAESLENLYIIFTG